MSALAPTSFDLTDRDAVRQLMSNQRHHMRQLDSGMKNLGAIYMIIKDFIGLFFVTKWVTLTKNKVRNSFYQERFYNDQKDLSSNIIFHHCSSSYLLKQYGLHVKASPDSPDSPDSPKRFFEKYDVFLIENGKISDFKLF